MNSDESPQTLRRDQTALRANIALIAGVAILAVGIIYSAIAGLGWLPWLLAHGVLLSLAVIILALIGWFLFALTQQKNIAWRSLRQQFGTAFEETLDRQNFATGRGQVGDYAYFGLRCFGSPGGIEIGRIMSFVNPPLYIPWSAMTKIDTFPSLLTGRKDFETDMQAQLKLRDQPELSIEVPWLTEYRQLLPKSVKYRSIKLSKK